MKFALEVFSADFDAVLAACVHAEARGFDGFYYGESPHGLNLECWTMLAALAQATRRIRLGPVITNLLPAWRSVALLGKQAATVAVIAGGRLDFRTGVGAAARYGSPWWQPFGVEYAHYGARLADLGEALPLLCRFWRNEPVSFGGTPVRLGFTPPPIPVTLAATGRRAQALAARMAQVWETSWVTPGEYAARVAAFPRQPGTEAPARSVEVDAFAGPDPDAAARVLELARAERRLGKSGLAALRARSLAGAPAELARQMDAYRTAGAGQLLLVLPDPTDLNALDVLADAVALFRG